MEEKKEPLYPHTLTKPVVVDCNKRGKSGYRVAEEAKRKGWRGSRGERAEVAGQGTQSSGIKPSRLLPTSREFSPFSPSDPASCPHFAFRCGEKTADDGVRGRADSIYPRCSSGLIGHFLLSICD